LESPSPDNAAKILAKNGANWPQVMLTDDLKKRFRIGAFPKAGVQYLNFEPGGAVEILGPVQGR